MQTRFKCKIRIVSATVHVHSLFTQRFDARLHPYSLWWHIACPRQSLITRVDFPNSKNTSHMFFLSSTNLIHKGSWSTWWLSTSPASIVKNLAVLISWIKYFCSTLKVMFMISFWIFGEIYVALWGTGHARCSFSV